MVEFGFIWLSLVWFGVVEFGLEDDLNENTIVDTWMEDNPNPFYTWQEDDLDLSEQAHETQLAS